MLLFATEIYSCIKMRTVIISGLLCSLNFSSFSPILSQFEKRNICIGLRSPKGVAQNTYFVRSLILLTTVLTVIVASSLRNVAAARRFRRNARAVHWAARVLCNIHTLGITAPNSLACLNG
ncbi:hypothetical protein K440DRAFT_71725 [Wilcoxina mikolae CBS 423.85]|nr:hypothetical protein K440DRAFT_71725 [Wilcoxina mikolae CBS 423.85]